MKYYKLPLNIASFIQKDSPDKQVDDEPVGQNRVVDVLESIRLNIQLILRTRLKSCRFDTQYGYIGWSKDFENIDQDRDNKKKKWEDEVTADLEAKIIAYEKRLINVRVRINLRKGNSKSSLQNHQFFVKVEAKLKETKDTFAFEEFMYFSPIRISTSRY